MAKQAVSVEEWVKEHPDSYRTEQSVKAAWKTAKKWKAWEEALLELIAIAAEAQKNRS